MDVLAVCHTYPDPYLKWFTNYLRSLEGQGVTVDVLAVNRGNGAQPAGRNSLYAKAPALSAARRMLGFVLGNLTKRSMYVYLGLAWKLSGSLREFVRALSLMPLLGHRPDVVHCHSEIASYYLLPLLKYFGVPIVMTFHGLQPKGVPELPRDKRDKLYSQINLLCGNTRFAIQQWQAINSAPLESLVVTQGIDVAEFPFQPSTPPAEGPLVLLTVARLDYYKGQCFVLDALSELRRKGILAEYWMVGAGLFRSELENKVASLELGDCVKFLGKQSGEDLLAILRRAHVFILPSFTEELAWAETQGIVLQEAQACGLVTIATRSGGIPECVNTDSSLLIPPADSQAIAEAVEYLLDHPDQWAKRQLIGRRWVESRFDYRMMGMRLKESYQQLRDQGASGHGRPVPDSDCG